MKQSEIKELSVSDLKDALVNSQANTSVISIR